MAEHSITPSLELVEQWSTVTAYDQPVIDNWVTIATQAARWGADQELEACCADIHTVHGQHQADWLRSMRRPKPPSLKERALQAWAAVEAGTDDQTAMAVIRRALEQLDDH